MLAMNRSMLKKIGRALAPFLNSRGRFSSRGRIITSGLPDVDIPRISLNEYVMEHVSCWEDRTAIECAQTGRKYTYSQVRIKSRNLSGAFRKKLKLQKGDVIAVLLPNVPEFPIVLLGALKAGVISTTINPIYTPAEISRQLLDSSAKALITLNEIWPLASSSVQLLRKDIPILTINSRQEDSTPVGATNFTELTDNDIDFTDVQTTPDDVALMPYSSGTTGLPKGVLLTHYNIVSNLRQLEHPLIGVSEKTIGNRQDVTPAILPMFHIYGMTVLCMYQLRLGCKVITLPKFTPEMYINTLRNERPDVLYLAPPIAIFLANHPSVKREDFSSVRAMANGAAPLGVLDTEKLLKKAERRIPLLQGYGLTETSPTILTTRISFLTNKNCTGALGLPVPNTEVKIVDPDHPSSDPLPSNQIGELLVKGPQVMKGYHNVSDEDMYSDGWLRTGDMMYYNDEGFLFITGRLKELIKVKGFQVAPAELEEIIRDFPSVIDAAVIGIPHETHGEVPRAYVVPRKGAKIDEKKLRDYVNSLVAPYKQLRGGIRVLDSIPKNASGKILRNELKSFYEDERKSKNN